MWFAWRFESVFVYDRDLATAVTGVSYGNDLDDLRRDVEAAIRAHQGRPYDMTVAVSQRSVVDLIRLQR